MGTASRRASESREITWDLQVVTVRKEPLSSVHRADPHRKHMLRTGEGTRCRTDNGGQRKQQETRANCSTVGEEQRPGYYCTPFSQAGGSFREFGDLPKAPRLSRGRHRTQDSPPARTCRTPEAGDYEKAPGSNIGTLTGLACVQTGKVFRPWGGLWSLRQPPQSGMAPPTRC